jgi:hypothetical protein
MELPLHNKSYLRVRTPQTTDGVNLRYTADERIDYKESHLPLTAKKHLEAENENLPNQLKHKIEVVDPATGEGETSDAPKKRPGRPALSAKVEGEPKD